MSVISSNCVKTSFLARRVLRSLYGSRLTARWNTTTAAATPGGAHNQSETKAARDTTPPPGSGEGASSGEERNNSNGGGGGGDPEREMKERVFEAALQFVPKHGWSRKALAAGSESVGLPGVAHGLFPDGAPDLIHHFYLHCNALLVEQMVEQRSAEAEGRVEKKRTPQFVTDSVEARLRMNIPYIDTWAQAMGIMALPGNARRGWDGLCSLTDDIWHHAGDTSTDLSWYTKRMSLAGVYKATEIYMLQDESEDFEDTWQFLNNRIKDVGTVGKTFGQVQNFGANLGGNLWTLSQLTRNMMGVNDRRR